MLLHHLSSIGIVVENFLGCSCRTNYYKRMRMITGQKIIVISMLCGQGSAHCPFLILQVIHLIPIMGSVALGLCVADPLYVSNRRKSVIAYHRKFLVSYTSNKCGFI